MGARLNWRGFGAPARHRPGASATTGSNLDTQFGAGPVILNKLQNPLNVMLLQPINHEPVGCKQTQHSTVIDGLKRAYPGVELLLGKLRLKNTQTLIP